MKACEERRKKLQDQLSQKHREQFESKQAVEEYQKQRRYEVEYAQELKQMQTMFKVENKMNSGTRNKSNFISSMIQTCRERHDRLEEQKNSFYKEQEKEELVRLNKLLNLNVGRH